MKKIKTAINGVYILKPRVLEDDRGWFTESYNKELFHNLGITNDFVQDNQSFSSKKGTLRGIHFQLGKAAQAKLVRCTKGIVLDVVVDLRKSSPTYKKWVSVELSEENKLQLFIPRGFGHAFLTLSEDCEFMYKVDNYYSKEHDRTVIWNDSEIGIEWPLTKVTLSDKDLHAKPLREQEELFE